MEHNIIIILLERAQERVDRMTNLIKERDIKNVYFYNAVDGTHITNPTVTPKISLPGGWRNGDKFQIGEIGCIMSHLGAVTMAKAMNWSHVIIFEDDINICEDFEKRINYLFKIVPNDWEHIFLSGTPHLPPNFMNNWVQVIPSVKTDCAHSYIIRNTAYNKVIKKLTSMETTTDDMLLHMMFVENNLKSYTYFPFVTHSMSSNSYIWNKPAGHNIKNESKNYFKNKI